MTRVAILQLMAEERGLAVDLAGFERCMQQQKQRGRDARKTGGGDRLKFEAEATAHLAKTGVQRTDDKPKCALSSSPSSHDSLTTAMRGLPVKPLLCLDLQEGSNGAAPYDHNLSALQVQTVPRSLSHVVQFATMFFKLCKICQIHA